MVKEKDILYIFAYLKININIHILTHKKLKLIRKSDFSTTTTTYYQVQF